MGRSRHFLDGQLVDQLAAAGRLTGLGLVRCKALDKVLQLLDLLLVLAVLILDHALNQLRGLIPELVVADIHLYLGIIDIDYSRADIIEEMAVMRNDYDRSEILAQEILEPLDGGYIEVVRRLVEQDYIGVAEKRLCKQDFDLLRTGERRHLLIEQALFKAETLNQL